MSEHTNLRVGVAITQAVAVYPEGDDRPVCRLGEDLEPASAVAYARAFASVPDLLAALEAADAVMGALDARVDLTTLLPGGPLQVWVNAHRQVREALQKARGNTNG